MDLPEPLQPITPTMSPFSISKFTSLSAQKSYGVGMRSVAFSNTEACGSGRPSLRATQLSIWSTNIWRLMTPRRYFLERFSTRMTGGTGIKSCEWRVAGSGWDYGRKEAQKDTKKEGIVAEDGRRVTRVEKENWPRRGAKRREKN